MPDQEKTPSWKSFLFAIGGAYAIFCSIYLGDVMARPDKTMEIFMAIWGSCFWAGGIGNLFVDRRLARNQNRVP